jgi:hypothetical protein
MVTTFDAAVAAVAIVAAEWTVAALAIACLIGTVTALRWARRRAWRPTRLAPQSAATPKPHRLDPVIVLHAVNGHPLKQVMSLREQHAIATICARRGQLDDQIGRTLRCSPDTVAWLLTQPEFVPGKTVAVTA